MSSVQYINNVIVTFSLQHFVDFMSNTLYTQCHVKKRPNIQCLHVKKYLGPSVFFWVQMVLWVLKVADRWSISSLDHVAFRVLFHARKCETSSRQYLLLISCEIITRCSHFFTAMGIRDQLVLRQIITWRFFTRFPSLAVFPSWIWLLVLPTLFPF